MTQIRPALLGLGALLFSVTPTTAQGGPSQPEAMQFEPVDITDVVNLATGDFVYSIPLMTVPGPEGGYPISMSYHSGIGPNQEATWVGLGWTLNPGAINRLPNGYPDEVSRGDMTTAFFGEGDWEYVASVGVHVGIKFGAVGLNFDYDTSEGRFGVNAVASLAPTEAVAYGVTPSVGLSAGTSGFSGNMGLSRQFGAIALGGGVEIASDGALSLSGTAANQHTQLNYGAAGPSASFAVSESVGFSFNAGGVGMSYSKGKSNYKAGVSTAGSGSTTVTGFHVAIPIIKTPFLLTGGVTAYKWSIAEWHFEESYGYSVSADFLSGTSDDRRYEVSRKVTDGNEDLLFSSQDVYQVSGQGIGGTFQPFHTRPYDIKLVEYDDDSNGNTEARVRTEFSYSSAGSESEVVYKFVDDPGGNLASPSSSGFYAGINIDQVLNSSDEWFGSRKVTPFYKDGKFSGFTIRYSDGKSYEYHQPVLSRFEYSWTRDFDPPGAKFFTNTSQVNTPYATQWLLTAVRGPDWVDRGDEGVGEGDWGYWVAFNYQSQNETHLWRAPFQSEISTGTNGCSSGGPGMGGYKFDCYEFEVDESENIRSYAWGYRDEVYLSSIETETHSVKFEISESLNRDYPKERERWGNYAFRKLRNTSGENESVFMFRTAGNLEVLLEKAGSGDRVFHVTGGFNTIGQQCSVNIEKHEESKYTLFYDSSSDETVVRLSKGANGSNSCGYHRPDQVGGYYTGPVNTDDVDPSYQSGKKLDRIELFNKSDMEEPVRTAVLSYNWDLRRSFPTSTAPQGGSLALESVKWLGSGSENQIETPGYSFRYGQSRGSGDLNPDWQRYAYDRWGSFRDGTGSYGPGDIDTPQVEALADRAAAWSMSEIATPTGALIKVGYESKDYASVAGTPPMHVMNVQETYPQNWAGTTLTSNVVWYDGAISDGDKVYISARYTKTDINNFINTNHGHQQFQIYTVNDVVGNYIILDRNVTFCGAYSTNEFVTTGAHPSCSGQNIAGPGESSMTTYAYGVAKVVERVFGGGVRVNRIDVDGLGDAYSTIYSYINKNGSPSGVASSLPQEGEDQAEAGQPFYDQKEAIRKLSADHYSRFGGPAASVMHGRVVVSGHHGSHDGGAVAYGFYTPEDQPYFASASGRTTNRTSIYGMPRYVEYMEGSPSSNVLVKKESFEYAFSDNLGGAFDPGQAVDGSDYPNIKSVRNMEWMGVTQERYKTFDKDESQMSNLAYMHMGVFRVGMRAAEYVDSGTAASKDSIVSTSMVLAWDVHSGQPVEMADEHPNGVTFSRSFPAHWLYPDMRDKRMLSQPGAEVSYFSRNMALTRSGAKAYEYPASDVLQASMSTWSQNLDVWDHASRSLMDTNGAMCWRKNDMYVYERGFGVPYRLPVGDELTYQEETYLRESPAFPWRMTSNVTKYDKYSNPVESVGPDRSCTSSQYNAAGLPTAIATRACLGDWMYRGYNYTSGLTFTHHARTGYAGRTILGGSFVSTPSSTGNYTVEVWVRPDGGGEVRLEAQNKSATSLNDHIVVTKSGWILLKLSGISENETVSMYGSGSMDDVRIYSQGARLRTFAYDPLTQQVTSITDEANATAFFEYDAAGRLVHVRDEDGNLLKRHQYSYARDESAEEVKSYVDPGVGTNDLVLSGPNELYASQSGSFQIQAFNMSGSDIGDSGQGDYDWSIKCDGFHTDWHVYHSSTSQDVIVSPPGPPPYITSSILSTDSFFEPAVCTYRFRSFIGDDILQGYHTIRFAAP